MRQSKIEESHLEVLRRCQAGASRVSLREQGVEVTDKIWRQLIDRGLLTRTRQRGRYRTSKEGKAILQEHERRHQSWQTWWEGATGKRV